MFSEPLEVIIHVGGVSARENPLGLVASWNMGDLIEEYTRPAKARIGGRLVEFDPLIDATTVEVPGVGVFDALPTDGLRTLLQTLPSTPTLIEYTLRYRGHASVFRVFKQLGFLSDKVYAVDGHSVQPRTLLAKLLENSLPREEDRVIVYVKSVGRSRDGGLARVEYLIDVSQDELGLRVPVLTYLTGFMHAWFTRKLLEETMTRTGVVPPEEFAVFLPEIIIKLREKGVRVEKRTCIEE